MDHYLRGWNPEDKHIKGFALRLDKEQADLLNDDVTITLDQKKTHYMLQMWDCGHFDNPIMTRWTQKPAADKTHANARTFFEAETAGIES